MSKTAIRRRKSAARRNHRRVDALHRRKRPAHGSIDRGEEVTRSGWMAAMRVRKIVQARIVVAFRRQIAGCGPGPTDEELRMFARLAVAEQRLSAASHAPTCSRPAAARGRRRGRQQ